MRRRRATASAIQASRTQSFICAVDLLRAFEHRAFELGCSFDWLMEEAMQRLLAERDEAESVATSPQPPPSVPRAKPPPPPLPPPPDTMPSTVPPPLSRTRLQAALAPPPPPPLPPPPPVPTDVDVDASVDEPLVLHCAGERLVITRDGYVIGRSAAKSDFVIESGEVSREHAVIEHLAGGWVITDLGSTNGIIVDGEVVRHAALHAGVVLSIGPMAFAVASPE